MKWIAVALAVTFATPLLAAEEAPLTPEKEGAVMIISACAELWATDTYPEMMKAFDTIQAEFGIFAQRFDKDLRAAWDAYMAARDAYSAAYDAETASLQTAVKAGGDLLLRNLTEDASKPEGTLDQWVDYAVGTGKNVKDAAQIGLAVHEDTEGPLAKAERAMKDARIAYLKARDESNTYYDLIMPVAGCGYDQRDFLEKKGQYEDPDAPRVPPPPLETVDGPPMHSPNDPPMYRTGFMDAPYGMPQEVKPPADLREGATQWPEECQKMCLADSTCIAWNYLMPGPNNSRPLPVCELFTNENPVKFTGEVVDNPSYISGWGPAVTMWTPPPKPKQE